LPPPARRSDNKIWRFVTDPILACISQGQLALQGDAGEQILESPFGRSLRDRAVQIYNRHAWKTQGPGGQSLSRALRTPTERDPSEFRIAITSVTRGTQPGELLYTLETDEISGMFSRDAEGIEKRLFHTADYRIRDLDAHPDGAEIAACVFLRNGMANLAVLKIDGSDLTEVTDGDSVDQAPRWAPGPGRRLVFQSSGLGRDAVGRFARRGAATIQQLDLETREITCLAQDAGFDFLCPRIAADGSLYYIRRPNLVNAPPPVNPWLALQHTVLLPFRTLWVIGRLIDLFVEHKTGSPLFGTGTKQTGPPGAKIPDASVLMRQPAADPTKAAALARGVRSFDFATDGSVIYSDGSAVYRMPANGGTAAKILAGENIDCIAAL
jgi:hypothetical protein